MVNTRYIKKASPWENAYVESFNGKLRDELQHQKIVAAVPQQGHAAFEGFGGIEQWLSLF